MTAVETVPSETGAAPGRSDRRLLLFVLLNILTVNVGFKLVADSVFHVGIREMRPRYLDFLDLRQTADSWGPMLGLVDFFVAHPGLPIYQAKIRDTMNYPLTSTLPLLWMKRAGMGDWRIHRTLMFASWLAFCAVIALQGAIAARVLGRERFTWQAALATAVAAFFFMPIALAYSLGQAQIFVDLFFALLIFFWIEGRERAAGVTMALLAMVKPQFSLLLLWTLLRGRWGALTSGLVTLAAGVATALATFGLRNNLAYLDVLSGLTRQPRALYANQSISGLLNRAIFNGENLRYHAYVFPPLVPWIHYATLATALALVTLALAFPWRERAGGIADLSTMAVTAVLSPPIVWDHHYGVMLPIFVWLWFGVYRPGFGSVWKLALAFILISNLLAPLNLLAAVPVANVLQSYMYFGGLLLLGLLLAYGMALRRQAAQTTPLQMQADKCAV